jgi:hypothetical protein
MAAPIVRTFVIDTTESEQNLKELNVQLAATSTAINSGAQSFDNVAVAQDEVVASSKSLKAQLRELQAQLANTAPDSAKYRELSQAAGELKDKVQDAAQAVGTQAGGAFERVGGSLGLVTSRIASLDFEGAAEGAKLLAKNIGDIKPGDITKGIKGIGSALGSVGKALLTNPIFLIGAAIAAAVVYSKELLSLIDGVTDADQALLEVQKEKTAQAKQQFDAIGAQEESLKRQGFTEEEILQKKLDALDAAILEAKITANTTAAQAQGQIDAAKRNADYLKTFLDFISIPQRKIAEFFEGFINTSIGLLNKLGFDFEKIDIVSKFDEVNNFIVKKIFDPEQVQKDTAAATAAAAKELQGLENTRDGLLNSRDAKNKAAGEKAAADAKTEADKKLQTEIELAKKILDIRAKVAEESAKIGEKIRKDSAKPIESAKSEITDFSAEITAQRDAEELRISSMEEGVEKEIALTDLKFVRLRDQAGADAELKKQIAKQNQDEVDAIVIAGEEKKRQEQLATVNQGIELAQGAVNAIQGISDAAFANKLAKVKKGSAQEEALFKKQFQFNKKLQLAGATMDAAKAVTSSLAQAPVAIGPVPSPVGIASLALASATGIASIAKIAATKYESPASTSSSPPPSIGGGGGGDTGSQPAQFNPLASSFLQDRPDQVTPRAYVLAGDVASQQEVREKVQDLARIG